MTALRPVARLVSSPTVGLTMIRILLVLIAAGTLATSIADTASAQQLVARRDVSYALALAIATGAVDACRALGFASTCRSGSATT